MNLASTSSQTPAEPPLTVDGAQLRATLHNVPHLCDLPAVACQDIAPRLVVHDFPAGGILFYEDDPSDGCYFLASGAVEVFKSNSEGKKLPLLVLRDGGVLGEIGLLIGEDRTATARALSSVRVYHLPRADFESAVAQGDAATTQLILCFSRVLATRLRATDDKLFDLFESEVSAHVANELSETRTKLLRSWTE